VDDVVLGDVGEELVSTAGVAVRPFWWSDECLAAPGDGGGPMTTDGGGPDAAGPAEDVGGGASGQDSGGDGDGASAGPGANQTEGHDADDALEGESMGARESGLGSGWIAFIAVVAAIAGAAVAMTTYLLLRSRRSGASLSADAEAGAAPSSAAASAPTSAPVSSATTEEDAPAFCSRCGASLDPGDKFCSSCGRRL